MIHMNLLQTERAEIITIHYNAQFPFLSPSVCSMIPTAPQEMMVEYTKALLDY